MQNSLNLKRKLLELLEKIKINELNQTISRLELSTIGKIPEDSFNTFKNSLEKLNWQQNSLRSVLIEKIINFRENIENNSRALFLTNGVDLFGKNMRAIAQSIYDYSNLVNFKSEKEASGTYFKLLFPNLSTQEEPNTLYNYHSRQVEQLFCLNTNDCIVVTPSIESKLRKSLSINKDSEIELDTLKACDSNISVKYLEDQLKLKLSFMNTSDFFFKEINDLNTMLNSKLLTNILSSKTFHQLQHLVFHTKLFTGDTEPLFPVFNVECYVVGLI